MPFVEIFAIAAPEITTTALGAAEAAGAMEAAGALGAADLGAAGAAGAFDAGVGLGGGILGSAIAPTTGAGITQAVMAPATQGIVSGGAGAGAAGINPAMVNAAQNAATAVPNAGIVGNADKAALLSNEGYGPYTGIEQASSMSDNPFMKGVGSVMDWMDKFSKEHPYYTAAGAYLGAKKLGLFDDDRATAADRTPVKGIGYSMSPNFQGRFANPQDFQYTPKRYSYAEGGIMQAGGGPVEAMSNANAVGADTGYPMANIDKGAYATPWQTPIPRNVVTGDTDTNVNPNTGEMRFAKGGDLSSSLDYYTRMMDQRANPPEGKGMPRGERGDPGIYYDLDPDTQYQDALTAAQIRMAKINKRANMQVPGMRRPTPMGQINLAPPGAKREASGSSLDPENAAQGGIMHSSLGGYAAGGNPRLLKGPGDGMSDDIPATINARQPARLADGEFVVPADVVSHLGNGSTDAGAKKLHQMMTKVRKERTGNPKQGKQINPNKFMPK